MRTPLVGNKRLFFALDINKYDKANINQWREETLRLPYKAIAKDNFHITLSFIGTADSATQVPLIEGAHAIFRGFEQRYINYTRKTLSIDTVELFKKPKVAYLSFQSKPTWLAVLAKDFKLLAKKLNIYQEDRAYCPHISIYRKAVDLPSDLPALSPALTKPIEIDSFSLYESVSTPDGVKYTPIKSWQFN